MAHSAQRQSDDRAVIQSGKHAALSMGSEDLSGFWELIWELRQQHPEIDDSRLLKLTREAVSTLLLNQLIRAAWWDPETDAETDLTPNEAVRLLDDVRFWMPPQASDSTHLRFVTTTSGDRAYYANLAG